MYEDKIKKELFDKMHKLMAVEEKLDLVDDSDEERCDELGGQLIDLLTDIDLLQLETIYFPLTGLTDDKIKEINALEPKLDFTQKKEEDLGRIVSSKNKVLLEEFYEGKEKEINELLEKHLNTKLLELKEAMKERIRKIKPFRTTIHLEPYISHIYKQIIKCYIYGAFEASCVLCRAMIESIAKEFIKFKGYGELVVGKNKEIKTKSIPDILFNELRIDKNLVSLYGRITSKADNILHAKKTVAETDALEAIKSLQELINKFPKRV